MIQSIKNITPSFLNSRLVSWSIKLLVIVGFLSMIYYQIIQKNEIHELWNNFKLRLSASNIWLLVFGISLMPINWILESTKWRKLLSLSAPITSLKAIQAVLCGLSIGLITPQRVGEYGGRAIVLKTDKRWRSVVATLYSSISQNIANLTLGLIGMVIFSRYYLQISNYLVFSCIALIGVGILTLIAVYFNLGFIKKHIGTSWFRKYFKKLKLSDQQAYTVSESILIESLLLSIIRYLVYISQYVLFLMYFGVDAELIALFSGVATIYLLQSSIPLPPLFGVLARGEIAILVWSIFGANELSILGATFALWIINLLVPAILGVPILLNAKIIQEAPKSIDVKS